MWETRRFQQTKSVSVDCRGAQGFTKPCSMVIYLGVGVASQFFGHGANACHSHHADRHEQWMPRKETPTGGRWLRCGHVSTSQRKGNQGSQQQTVISCRHGWGLYKCSCRGDTPFLPETTTTTTRGNNNTNDKFGQILRSWCHRGRKTSWTHSCH